MYLAKTQITYQSLYPLNFMDAFNDVPNLYLVPELKHFTLNNTQEKIFDLNFERKKLFYYNLKSFDDDYSQKPTFDSFPHKKPNIYYGFGSEIDSNLKFMLIPSGNNELEQFLYFGNSDFVARAYPFRNKVEGTFSINKCYSIDAGIDLSEKQDGIGAIYLESFNFNMFYNKSISGDNIKNKLGRALEAVGLELSQFGVTLELDNFSPNKDVMSQTSTAFKTGINIEFNIIER